MSTQRKESATTPLGLSYVLCPALLPLFLPSVTTDHRTQHLLSFPRENALAHTHHHREDFKAELCSQNTFPFDSSLLLSSQPLICLSPPPPSLAGGDPKGTSFFSESFLSLSPTHSLDTQTPLGALPRLDMFSSPARPWVGD